MITWDKPDERYFEHGLDRGVLYIPGLNPLPWNGLTGFDEGGESGASTILYRDGVIYLADVDASDFSGHLTALFYPNEFHECLGKPEVTDGLYADNQKPKRFGFAYRTLVGSGTTGDMFGYQIHLVYQAMASIAARNRKTLGSDVTPIEFGFDIVCTPVKLAGYRPTAHYVIDTRNMSQSTVTQLENILYGEGATPGRMPSPQELFDIMNFGDAMVFTVHANKTYTVEGSAKNLAAIDSRHFQMKNINAANLGGGKYKVSTGGNTTVIIE